MRVLSRDEEEAANVFRVFSLALLQYERAVRRVTRERWKPVGEGGSPELERAWNGVAAAKRLADEMYRAAEAAACALQRRSTDDDERCGTAAD